jgi:tetratricopeptide (TPR) repeat protein
MTVGNDRVQYGLVAAILAIGATLWSADLFLARTETAEVRAESGRYYDTGTRLLTQGKPDQAVDPLRKAHSLQRTNRTYAVRLAEALIVDGKLDEAGRVLAELLVRTPNDGESNLLEARLTLRTGSLADALAYYHRAIYGSWTGLKPEEAEARKIQTRTELAELLAKRGMKQELLSELLALGPEAAGNLDVEKKVAAWYMAAGSPLRAADAYRALMGEHPDDLSNAAHYGEAQLALGNYPAAEIAFTKADELDRARLADQIAGLDPTGRTLSSAEKFRRSQRILEMARDDLKRCAGDPKLIDKASDLMDKKIRGAVTNELSEQRLSLTEQLWKARPAGCDDQVLGQITQKLAQ